MKYIKKRYEPINTRICRYEEIGCCFLSNSKCFYRGFCSVNCNQNTVCSTKSKRERALCRTIKTIAYNENAINYRRDIIGNSKRGRDSKYSYSVLVDLFLLDNINAKFSNLIDVIYEDDEEDPKSQQFCRLNAIWPRSFRQEKDLDNSSKSRLYSSLSKRKNEISYFVNKVNSSRQAKGLNKGLDILGYAKLYLKNSDIDVSKFSFSKNDISSYGIALSLYYKTTPYFLSKTQKSLIRFKDWDGAKASKAFIYGKVLFIDYLLKHTKYSSQAHLRTLFSLYKEEECFSPLDIHAILKIANSKSKKVLTKENFFLMLANI